MYQYITVLEQNSYVGIIPCKFGANSCEAPIWSHVPHADSYNLFIRPGSAPVCMRGVSQVDTEIGKFGDNIAKTVDCSYHSGSLCFAVFVDYLMLPIC